MWCVGLRGRATASNQAAFAALLLNRGADRRDARAWCGDCGSSQLRAALETPETALRDGAVVLAAVEKNDEDAVLSWDTEALRSIAERAHAHGLGARALVAELDAVFREFAFALPGSRVTELCVTEDLVKAPEEELRRLLAV